MFTCQQPKNIGDIWMSKAYTRRGGLLTLDMLPPGARARVVRIDAGIRAMRRIVEMGITPGAVVEVVMSYGGPILVRVRGTVIAIGRGIARRILVEPLTP